MEKYEYRALNKNGEVLKDFIEAKNRAAALEKISNLQLQPINLKIVGGSKEPPIGFKKPSQGQVRLNKSEVIFFTEELGDLLGAGLQLEGALGIMARRKEDSAVKIAAQKLRQQLRDGVAFSVALKSVSPSFDDLYCKLVAAGEQSGALDQILKSKLEHLKLMEDLRAKVTSALVYPAFIMGAGILLVIIFMTYLVPQLTSLFMQSGKAIPLITRLLIGTSTFLGSYWWAVLLFLIITGGVFLRYIKTQKGRWWWDGFQLKMPLVGKVLSDTFYSEFAQTLSTLTGNGVPLLNSIMLVQGTTANTHLKAVVKDAGKALSEGVSLSRALGKSDVFPNEFIDMIAVGEQTGQLPASLQKIAKRYDKELNQNIGRLTSLVQPAVVVLMAIVVGVVAFSMMSGIFQAVSSIRP